MISSMSSTGGKGPLGCKMAPGMAMKGGGYGKAQGKGKKGCGPYGAMAAMMPSFGGAGGGGGWQCPDCGFDNKANNTQCGGLGPLGCNAPRPSFDGGFAGTKGGFGSFGSNSGSWMCPECGFKNNPRNTQCGGSGNMGCNAPKPGNSFSGNDFSGGEPDWLCDCGFVNKARNEVCGGKGLMGCKKPRSEVEGVGL
mmetsp:Transcript_33898/g.55790  ORF Transcript_33898/g.55790 Transcript_33898/m.55790 type:complete len:195 (+) Transcript_33898:1-585(+)